MKHDFRKERPFGSGYHIVSYSIDHATYFIFTDYCKSHNIKMSKVVNALILEWLDKK